MTNPTHNNTSHLVPADRNVVEYEIKKSRFIGWACPAASREEALAWLNQAKTEFPDARHHCWAYQIGPPNSPHTAAMSDDGEPSGTAGKPILNVLQHKDIGNIMVIIIRYFGGIKLGAGGLVRAYSHTAQLAMDSLNSELKVAKTESRVQLPFEAEHALRHWLDLNDGEIIAIEYNQQAEAVCRYPINAQTVFLDFLRSHKLTIESE